MNTSRRTFLKTVAAASAATVAVASGIIRGSTFSTVSPKSW